MAFTRSASDVTLPRWEGVLRFPSCQRRRVARGGVRLGRKKQERTKQRRGAAKGLAQLFVAIHGYGTYHGWWAGEQAAVPVGSH